MGETWLIANGLFKKGQDDLKFHGPFLGDKELWKEICKPFIVCQFGNVLISGWPEEHKWTDLATNKLV